MRKGEKKGRGVEIARDDEGEEVYAEEGRNRRGYTRGVENPGRRKGTEKVEEREAPTRRKSLSGEKNGQHE